MVITHYRMEELVSILGEALNEMRRGCDNLLTWGVYFESIIAALKQDGHLGSKNGSFGIVAVYRR